MINRIRFYIFAILGIGLIANTTYLYPWNFTLGLLESSWIVLGTLAAIAAYYLAYLTNYAPFQTFVMRIIFWSYTGMLFLSVMRRTFEFMHTGIPPFVMLNTVLYLAIVLLCVIEGHRLFYSYGINKNLQHKRKIASNTSNSKINKEDLTIIEGIGPAIQKLLYQSKISTYEKLASTPAHMLKDILNDNNLKSHNPTTWPKQAKLASEKDWNSLKLLQKQLTNKINK